MIYSGRFGGIPSTGSTDIVGTRICHANADTDTDTNGIHTENNMFPLIFGGGHSYDLDQNSISFMHIPIVCLNCVASFKPLHQLL